MGVAVRLVRGSDNATTCGMGGSPACCVDAAAAGPLGEQDTGQQGANQRGGCTLR